MNLAIVLHSLSAGGAQGRIITIANALAARGHGVELVTLQGAGVRASELSQEVRTRVLDGALLRWSRRSRLKRRRQMIAAVPPLAAHLDASRPDVVLSGASHANIAALLGCRLSRARPPLVLRASNHLSRSSWNRTRRPRPVKWLVARWIYRWADAVIAVSEGVADDLVQWTRTPRERISVIHNPVVTPVMLSAADAPLAHPWLEPGSPPVILAAGRLARQKDHATLIRAFARLRAQRPARLVILGEGRQREALEALAESLGVAEDVALPGFTPNPFAWMRRASLLVVSSAWEGSPGVLIEALACGCPVVSTDCPSGPREILDDGRYGRLVPVGDAEALAEAMLATLDAPPPQALTRERAQLYTVERAVGRYLEVLSRTMRQHAGAPRRAGI